MVDVGPSTYSTLGYPTSPGSKEGSIANRVGLAGGTGYTDPGYFSKSYVGKQNMTHDLGQYMGYAQRRSHDARERYMGYGYNSPL